MKYLKISNLTTKFGQCNYKGLDIDKFIPGSQIYSKDLSFCLLATEGEITEHVDIQELSEEEYEAQRNEIIEEAQQEQQTIEQKLALLQKAIDDLVMGDTTNGRLHGTKNN